MNSRFIMVCMVALVGFILMGAGTISAYRGVVVAHKNNKIVIVLKNGQEKTCSTSDGTRVFLGGVTVAINRIKPHMRVQVAIDTNDVCRQIVTEEVPK